MCMSCVSDICISGTPSSIVCACYVLFADGPHSYDGNHAAGVVVLPRSQNDVVFFFCVRFCARGVANRTAC